MSTYSRVTSWPQHGGTLKPTATARSISTNICWLPLNSVEVKGERLKMVLEFLEELQDDDDVQNVYTNLITGIN